MAYFTKQYAIDGLTEEQKRYDSDISYETTCDGS